MLLYGIYFVLFIINGQSAPIHPKGTSNSSVTAMNFMKRYGYLATGIPDSEALYKESAVTDAIKTLQRFGNIPVTGNLDNATIKLMESRRCGLPDIIRGENRAKRYIIGSKGWLKRDITYFVANWSPKLGEEPVIDEIERAFDAWSGYSRLNFKPVNNPNADIIIAFGQGHHGDEYPFDGPGNILAHAFFPYEMDAYGGDIHFDDDENWMIRPSDQDHGETDFFTVAVHELGHSLGLSHSPIPSSIMFPYYKGYSPGLQLGYDDILAMYHLYISQPLVESETTDIDESKETTRIASSTTSNEEKESEEVTIASTTPVSSSNEEKEGEGVTIASTTPVSSTNEEKEGEGVTIASTTQISSNVTFLGDYETVEEHRGHESTSTLQAIVIPDICSGSYDSVSMFRNELFIFKGQYLWRFATRGIIKDGYPMRLHRLFHGMPENVTRVDAVYERNTDGSIVLFSGRSYWVYDGNGFIENSPRTISDYGLPNDVAKINAAQVWAKNGKVYLYSGDLFWRYNENSRSLDSGYPQHMNRWRGVPHNIDAAVTWTDGCTYFFKGTEFWRFDNVLIKTEEQYPQKVSDFWFRCS